MGAASPAWSLRVPGEPRGYERVRHQGSFHHFKSRTQEAYEGEIILRWRAAGSPQLPEGPYRLEVQAWMAMPKGFVLKDGSLSAEARRRPYPTRPPDADNLLKQVDVLVRVGAVPDDALMVTATAVKRWATDLRPPALVFVAKTLVVQEDGA